MAVPAKHMEAVIRVREGMEQPKPPEVTGAPGAHIKAQAVRTEHTIRPEAEEEAAVTTEAAAAVRDQFTGQAQTQEEMQGGQVRQDRADRAEIPHIPMAEAGIIPGQEAAAERGPDISEAFQTEAWALPQEQATAAFP